MAWRTFLKNTAGLGALVVWSWATVTSFAAYGASETGTVQKVLSVVSKQ